jgi:4-hydroxybenzoate polyprenyltransferase
LVTSSGVRTVTALLQCASCRFAVFYFLPFFGAFAEVRPVNVRWLVLGAVYWLLHSMGTETVNRLSDRVEDAVNRPERTALCEQVGFTRLRHISIGLWVSVAVLDVVFVVLRPNVLLAVLLTLAGLSSLNYSYGLRLARNRYAAPLLLTFHFGGTFMIGWVIASQVLDASAWRNFLSVALPFVVVSCGTLIALGGVKDLTDVVGDAEVDYHSLWVTVARKHGKWLIWALVSTTFVLTGAFVAIGLYPPRFLLSFALIPAAILLRHCLWHSSTALEELVTREIFYQYWMLYLAVAVTLYAPGVETFAAVIGSLAYWVVTSQYLHWSGGVQQEHLRTIVNLASPTGRARSPRREVSDD